MDSTAVAPAHHFHTQSINKTHEQDLTFDLVDGATIPCFDLDQLEHLRGADRKAYIDSFGTAMREIGFVALKVPELTPLVDAALQESKDYFHRPLEDKMKDWHENHGQTGYSYMGLEKAAEADVPDLKEHYFVPADYTRWPEGRPGFEAVMKPYYDAMSDYSQRIMCLLMEHLGEPTDTVNTRTTGNLLRLAYYPARKEGDPSSAVWAAAHQDLNAITLLPAPEGPGLELWTKDGRWLPVTAPKGYMIVNAGDQMTIKTAGLITGTPHRVVNHDLNSKRERFSTIFFASWPNDYSLAPFEKCVDEQYQAGKDLSWIPRNVTCEENCTARLIELGAIPSPDRDKLEELQDKGLLTRPTQALIDQHPDLFPAKAPLPEWAK